jgi:hypothetical protein
MVGPGAAGFVGGYLDIADIRESIKPPADDWKRG